MLATVGKYWRSVMQDFRALPSSHYALLSLLFFAGLELIAGFHRWIWALSAILLALLAYGVILVRTEEAHRFHPTQAILPILTAAGLTGFSLFLPNTAIRHIYFVVAALVFFWLLKNAAKQAYPTWNWAITLLVLFLNMAVILGIRFHLFLPIMFVLTVTFAISFLLSAQAIRRLASSIAHTLLISLSLGLVVTEVVWVLQFLPLHFLVQAGIIVVVYYVFFHIISLSLENQLERRQVTEYAVLGTATLLLLLLSARWI